MLAAAAHCYADDFKGKFFYNWTTLRWLDGTYRKDLRKHWSDRSRVGRYLVGVAVRSTIRNARVRAGNRESEDNYRLGGRIFECPEDSGGARSYDMNFWASGIQVPEALPERYQMGKFFDCGTRSDTSRLILFGEAIGLSPTGDGRWVPGGEFGSRCLPGERFGGRKDGAPMLFEGPSNAVRWSPTGQYPTQIDYVRHGMNHDRSRAEGAVNFAYADGHVAWRKHTDLYDPETKRSTYDTMWSPIDWEVDE